MEKCNLDKLLDLIKSKSKITVNEKKDIFEKGESDTVCGQYELIVQEYHGPIPKHIKRDYSLIYKTGDIVFLSDCFLETEDEAIEESLGKNKEKLLFLYDTVYNFAQRPDLHKFSAITSFAVNTLDLEGKTVLDMGAAEGAQGLLCVKKGADKIYCIDKSIIGNTITENSTLLGINAKKNGFDSAQKFSYSFCDIDAKHYPSFWSKIRKKGGVPALTVSGIPLDKIDVVIANIGPSYGKNNETHLNAIRHSEYMPNLKTIVLGGYMNNPSHKLSPESAIEELHKQGFDVANTYFFDKGNAALIAKRG